MEAWLEEMAHRQPDSLFLSTKLADLRTLQGNYPEAEAIYRRSLGANRDNVEALNNLAWQVALREGSPQEALKLVDRALEIAGPEPDLAGHQGRHTDAVKSGRQGCRGSA